jgi:hypothetical protein
MPSFFCYKCHNLIVSYSQAVPNTFVCAECKIKSSAEVKGDVSSPESTE